MNPTLLMLVLAAQQGYWFGGREYDVTLAWNLEGRPPGFRPPAAAVLTADLKLGELTLSTTRVELDADKPVTVKLGVPEVRVRTAMRWHYRVTAGRPAQELTRGELELQVFPDDFLAQLGRSAPDRRLVVWDDAEGLPALLERAEVEHDRIAGADALTFAAPDLIFVGLDQLSGLPLEQSRLLGQARGGATVVVFRQTRVARVAGYAVVARAVPPRLTWREEHPLLAEFQPADLASWVGSARQREDDLHALRLPQDAAALELAYYPPELPGPPPGPRDALLVVATVGRGRVVLCQLPLEEWSVDPRSQLLLRSLMAYAASRPGPTPPPAQRPTPPAVPQTSLERVILVPSGAGP